MDNIEVLNVLAACRELTEVKMPFGAAMSLRKLYREVSSIAEDIEAERQKLLKEYGKKKDGELVLDGDKVVFEDEDGFVKAYDGLLRTEVEVINRVKASQFSNVEIEPKWLIALGEALED